MIELTMVEGAKILVNVLHVQAVYKREPTELEAQKEPKRKEYGTVVVLSGSGTTEIRIVVKEKYPEVKKLLLDSFNG